MASAVQYNFKIEEELKTQLDETMKQSGSENKAEFLAHLLNAYLNEHTRNISPSKELENFSALSVASKKTISDAFVHIARQLDANFSTFAEGQREVTELKKGIKDEQKLEKEKHASEIHMARGDANKKVQDAEDMVKDSQFKIQEVEEKLKREIVERKSMDERLKQYILIVDQTESVMMKNEKIHADMKQAEMTYHKETKDLKSDFDRQLREKNTELGSRIKALDDNKEALLRIRIERDQIEKQSIQDNKAIGELKKEFDKNVELEKKIAKLEGMIEVFREQKQSES